MARQVLPIAGAIVGAFFGAPQIGYAIGAIVGNAVDPEVIKGPTIGEANLQSSAEGVFRPIVFGTAAIKGNVIARGNRQVRTQRNQQGKGGGPVVEEQRVYWTFAIRLAEPVNVITRIWQDEKLVYDIRPGSPITEESAQYAERFRFYDGSEDQLPDPDLEVIFGVGNTPAYPGTAYVVFPNFDLTDRRESIPDFRFEVATEADPLSVGRWIFGPVAEDGAAGGSQAFFASAEHPLDLPSAPLTPIPVWLGGVFVRMSSANGAFFLQSLSTPAAVSFDHGLTFTQCSSVLSTQLDVTWSGENFYCGTLRSPDGITWSTIPNLNTGFTPVNVPTHQGKLAALYSSGVGWVEASINEAVSFSTARPTVNNWSISSQGFFQNSGRLHVTLDSTRGYYTDDLGQTWTAEGWAFSLYRVNAETGSYLFGRSQSGLDLVIRSEDDGEFWETVLSLPIGNLGSGNVNVIAAGDGLVAVDEIVVSSPADQHFIHVSTDGGDNWTTSSAIYGSGRNLAFVGGAQSSDPGPVTLSSIVTQLHLRAGHTPSQFNVSELTDEVEGIVFAGDYNCADAIRALMTVYFFDASEYDQGSGYKIHYIKRGKPVVRTLTEADLIEAPETTVRADAFERPKVLHLHYENPTIGYAPAKATNRRDSTDIKVVGEKSIQVPVSFTDVNEPAQIVSKMMKVIWVEVGGEEEFTVHDGHLDLVPSDCVGVSLRGLTRRMRITGQFLEAGQIRLKMLPDRQSTYTSSVTGVPVPEPTPPLPSIVGDTVFSFLDIPSLNDNNDRLGWYEADSGQTEAWYGAQNQRKVGAQTEFENTARFTQNTIMGTLMAPITSASEHYTDTTNVVTVELFTDDDIESLTDEQFLSEGGAFALEKPDGTFEVMQYRDSVDIASRTFELSTLLRGRLNSGPSSHAMGARFVLLDAVQMVDATTSMLNQNVTSRAISFGNSPDGALQYVNPYVGRTQIEFPVANILGEIVGTNLELRIVPRHRFGTEDTPVRSVNWTGYRVTATDGANSFSTDTTSDTLTIDVTGWSDPVTVTVAQLNRFTGPGPTVSEDFP